ncbi:MAG: CDP-alcohol phosphatidyltransferase family protein [Thaumarchaeota archaeon]|jgi:archaetidylinositol phosphate synthase|nr:CDP-alcohol phosphatidyltransferase family protein [Nitrososphaerota archaeon]
MLNRLRQIIEPLTAKIGAAAAKTHIPPSGWTALSLVAALASSYFYAIQSVYTTILAGVMLLLTGFLDVVDGAVARATNRVSNMGAFLDSSLDRLAEVLVFVGVMLGGYAPAYLVLLALSFSLLVSYSRARGESLGVKVFGVGLGERAERIIVLAALTLIGFVYLGIIVVLILAVATYIQRFIYIVKALKRSS